MLIRLLSFSDDMEEYSSYVFHSTEGLDSGVVLLLFCAVEKLLY
jgi:hypothetical protein